MDRPVVIMSALPGELDLLQGQLANGETTTIRDRDFRTGTIRSHRVVLTAAGIGKVNAAMVTTLAIDHFDPQVLIVTGVAGGVDDTLGIGDVVVAEHVLHHDTGVLEPDGFHLYQSGHVPFLNPTGRLGYRPSVELLEGVRARLDGLELAPVLDRRPSIVFGTIATGDQFFQSDAGRRRLQATLGAQAVEMEGAAVAQVAGHFGVDHLVIRGLSDLAGGDASFDFNRFLDDVTANSAAVVLAVLETI